MKKRLPNFLMIFEPSGHCDKSEKKVVKVKQVKAQIHTVDCNHADRNDFYRNRNHENLNTKSSV